MFYLKRSVSAWIILICVVCWLQAAPSFAAVDYWPTQGWRASTPEEQGMDAAKLADMLESVKEKNYGIDSITIVRNGYAVTDAYFYPFRKGMKHIIHSCTKSITDVNQPVLEFFPDQTFITLIVSAFKDGKCVFLTAHPWQYPDEVAPIVESLTFKE